MRSFAHWNRHYIADRVRVMIYEYRSPKSPWLTRSMAEILESWLRPSDVGVEYGSGRSTVWFAYRVAHLISIEHDRVWYAKVRKLLQEGGVQDRVSYRLLEDEGQYKAASECIEIANTAGIRGLDFALIDGMARDHCALATLNQVKPGGILIVDNIEEYLPRERKSRSPNARGRNDGYASEGWRRFGNIVRDWRCIWTTNGVWDTALWVKPAVISLS